MLQRMKGGRSGFRDLEREGGRHRRVRMKVDREVLREGQAESRRDMERPMDGAVARGGRGAEGRRRDMVQARLSGPLWLQASSACEPVFLALD